MSGGCFEYDQFKIMEMAKDLKELIQADHEYSEETLKEFDEGLKLLEKAFVYAHRIDWLVSGDDSEETFHKRLSVDLSKIDIN